MADRPKRLYGLGWIEVNNLRPEPKGKAGKSYINLDLVSRIHFPEGQPGVVTIYYPDGSSESLEEENCSRVLGAIEEAWINRPEKGESDDG